MYTASTFAIEYGSRGIFGYKLVSRSNSRSADSQSKLGLRNRFYACIYLHVFEYLYIFCESGLSPFYVIWRYLHLNGFKCIGIRSVGHVML